MEKNSNGFSSLRSIDDKLGKNSGKKYVSSVVEEKTENKFNKGKNRRRNQRLRKVRELNDVNSSVKSIDTGIAVKSLGSRESRVGNVKSDKQVGEVKGKRLKQSKESSPEVQFRVGLDMCSKRGDAMKAIQLYDLAQKEGIKLGQYHYTVLLYLCSSAAVGIIRPAKSGSGSRTLDTVDSSGHVSVSSSVDLDKSGDLRSGPLDGSKPNVSVSDNGHVKEGSKNQEDQKIWVDEDAKEYARKRGFEIYKKMCLHNIPMNEAALTSVARMAMSMGDGDMAFDMVKQMKSLGINPRLRSYGPALSAFSNSGEFDKAFAVEQHMLDSGVYPEEPELQALLRVSVGLGRGEKVYHLMHKLRTSVRKVSPSTADLIVNWFNSKAASRVGKTKWDEKQINRATANGGGGWHGQGWLGRGKWSVLQTNIGSNGLCKCCGEKLVTIDLDPKETEKFAQSVASIAKEKEKHSNFQKFQVC